MIPTNSFSIINFRSLPLFFVTTLLLVQSNAQFLAWPGWDEITNIFVFGDSYTATGFLINGTQPNRANPLGNPDFPGRTFSNGRNWIDFLTYNYNDTFVTAHNFARGGASVDSFGLESIFRPFDHQVDRFFLPNYSQNNTNLTTWQSDTTLFATFFGINDVNFYYKFDNRTDYATMIMNTYDRYVQKLYDSGARNFLFLNVPPIHLAPFTVREDEETVALNKAAVVDFNSRITNMATQLTQRHRDAAVFLVDVYNLFSDVLEDPQSKKETAVYTNTTGFCLAYSARTYNEEAFNSTCEIPQKQYFWLDALHPTPPIHDALAAEIAAHLRGNEVIGSGRSDLRPNVSDAASIHGSSLGVLVAGLAVFGFFAGML